jgi:hypothetical protein
MIDDRGQRFPLVESLRVARKLVAQKLTTQGLTGRQAPVGEDFRSWADRALGAADAELLCRLAGLSTYHHDPGSLSAAFVWNHCRRSFLSMDRVREIEGGWGLLIHALEARAGALGVEIRRGDRVAELPDAPTVVATPLATASRLLDRPVRWPGARTVLVDVVSDPGGQAWPTLLTDVRSDLSTCCMIERHGPRMQAALGIAPGVGTNAGTARVEDTLDLAFAGWRAHVVWRRSHVVADSSGAVDPPGTTWRDRPGVEQGEDRFLAGDAVAAPGILAEVAVNSGIEAGRRAASASRARSFAIGWPGAGLSPERRLAVLAAVLPGGSVTTAGRGVDLEPFEETGPGYRLTVRAGTVVGTAGSLRLDAGRWARLVRIRARIGGWLGDVLR